MATVRVVMLALLILLMLFIVTCFRGLFSGEEEEGEEEGVIVARVGWN